MPKEDQGVQPGRYTLIPRALVFITRRDEVLLIKGTPHKRVWANRYNGVGGHIERGEDPLTAARRELFEETGLQVQRLMLRGVISVDTGQETGIGIYVFHGEYSGGELKESREGKLEWVREAQLKELPVVEDIPTLLTKVLHSPIQAPPFSAQYSYNIEGNLVIRFAE